MPAHFWTDSGLKSVTSNDRILKQEAQIDSNPATRHQTLRLAALSIATSDLGINVKSFRLLRFERPPIDLESALAATGRRLLEASPVDESHFNDGFIVFAFRPPC